MVGITRYIRHIRQTGIKEWWRMMQYIGDAKSGRMVGADAYVLCSRMAQLPDLTFNRFGNRYFENLNGEEEVPGAF